MSHTDPEILVLRALGETAGTTWDNAHAETCAHCRAELARLTGIVGVARSAEPLETPPPVVWDQIAVAVANGAAPSPVPARGDPREADGTGPRATRQGRPVAESAAGRRGRLVAALVGLIIGIGGTAGIAQLMRAPATRVVAQIALTSLPQFPQWQGASGTALIRVTASQREIAVMLNAPRQPGFYEVWLLARNGVSMISLGDLNASHTGTFTIPPGTDLRNYSRIDVSLQPFDGSTVHVKTSVVRGSLPAAALTAPATAG